MKGYRDTRLLEMLDYIDPKYIEKTKKYYKSVPVSGAAGAKIDPKKQIKYITALVAAVLLLSAFIPAVTYIIQNHLHFAGYSETTGGDTTLAPEITSEEITSSPEPESSAPETTEPEPTHETTEPLYDGTTASPEPEYDGSRGLVYKLSEDGKSAWLFGMGTCTDENIVVASTYDGVPVTAIGKGALAGYDRVKSVAVPDTVTTIENQAFAECKGIEKVDLPDSITHIGDGAFVYCTSLKKIKLPKNLTELTLGVLSYCKSLEEIIIPEAVTEISTGAFLGCDVLQSFRMHANVKKIGTIVFNDCPKLTSLDFAGTVEQWNSVEKEQGWNYDNVITTVHCTDGDVEITSATPPEPEHDGSQGLEYQIEGDHAVLVGIGSCTDKEIIVASTYKGLPITAIGRRAIYGVEGVTSIVISDTVTYLDFMAVSHCYDLESIHIPAGLTVMEESAIISFGNIRSITVDPKNPRYYSVNNCLIDRETKTLLLGCDTSIIPADGSIGTIAPHAFTMCKSIESTTIPEGVTKIGREAFYKCTSLRSVELPESLITIESSVFSNCSSLEKVKLGGKVEYMGEYVFSECEKLGEIILPDSLSFLGNYAFQGCIALKRAVLSKNLETLDLMVFASCKNLESVIIPEGIKNIGTDVFSDTALKEIIIPASVETIERDAFGYCERLMSVSFAGTVSEWIAVEKDVGWHTVGTFKSIRCADGDVKLYSDSEDGGSIGLEYEINADGKSVRLIGEGICTDARIVIASKFHGIPVTEIYFVALSSSSFIEEIVIPESVTVIRNGAFGSCNNLKKATLPSALENISDSVFADCESLESIVIPKKVKRIETWAFRDCKKLTELTFAGTVAEWHAIEKGRGNDWNEGCPFTVVHCSDGDATP